MEAWTKTRRLARIVALQLELSPADAEDLAQGVMLDLQTTDLMHRLTLSASPAAYMYSTLRNRGLDLVRKRAKEISLAPEPVPADSAEPTNPADESAAIAALRKELRRLPKEDLRLLRARFWAGLSIAEIARRRGEPYSRVAVRLFRLGRRLARRIAEGGSHRGRRR